MMKENERNITGKSTANLVDELPKDVENNEKQKASSKNTKLWGWGGQAMLAEMGQAGEGRGRWIYGWWW